MNRFGTACLLVATTSVGLLEAQEVKFIDMSNVRLRNELRFPSPSDCKKGESCVGGGYTGGSVEDGAADRRDFHALAIYLLRLNPADINPTEPIQAEFKIFNSGTAPIELPVSTDLSALQPADESVAFNYFSLTLVGNSTRACWLVVR